MPQDLNDVVECISYEHTCIMYVYMCIKVADVYLNKFKRTIGTILKSQWNSTFMCAHGVVTKSEKAWKLRIIRSHVIVVRGKVNEGKIITFFKNIGYSRFSNFWPARVGQLEVPSKFGRGWSKKLKRCNEFTSTDEMLDIYNCWIM